jgi:protein-histidine pros-kinase
MNDMGDIIGFLAIQRDITEHKRIIEMVKESEERFRSITQSANDAIITGDSKGNIIFWNNGAHNIFGFDNEEVIGKPLTVLMPEIYRDAHRNGLKRLVATGETHVIGNKVELSGMRKDGSLFPLELSLSTWNAGGAVFFTGIIGDITERKRVHKALMDSEEKYRKLYESSSDAIMLLDEKGFFDCNNATLQTFGFSNKEDFTKVHLSQVSPPYQPDGVDSLTAANNKIAEALRKGTNQFEWVHRNRNGEDFYADVLLNAFNFKGKRVLQATVRDITDRKRAQELHVVNVQLENESKAKSEFLASMSHELRTPLNAIIGFSDIMTLGIGGNLNETQKDYVNDIHNAGEHLLLIINDILDLSKVEAGKMELVNEKFSVHEMLEETITLIKFKAIKHHIKIIRDIDFQLEFMDGDKQKIIQVLFNLLSNAVKFSKEDGGTITIAVKKIDGMVSFSVSDTGIGIEKKNLDKLFKEFQQLDYGITRKYGGTGLGLVISKKLVELHGGKIIVESIYGEGSTFTFSIPVQQEVN